MSAVAALYNVPSSPANFAQWAFAHAAHHRDIIRRIEELGGGRLDEYVLDPFDPNDMGVWLYQHQFMHGQMDAALGISGYDLLDVNTSDQSEFAGWIWLNAQEHYQAANLLSIG